MLSVPRWYASWWVTSRRLHLFEWTRRNYRVMMMCHPSEETHITYILSFSEYIYMRVDKLILPTSFWGIFVHCMAYRLGFLLFAYINVVATPRHALFIWLSFFILSLSTIHPSSLFCLECAFDIHFSAYWIGGNFGGIGLALCFHWRCMSVENRSVG